MLLRCSSLDWQAMNMIDRDLEAVKKIADALTPLGIHVHAAKIGPRMTANVPLTSSGVELPVGEYATLEATVYVPLEPSS